MASGSVSLAGRQPPLVLTLDIGSSSVRCSAFDAMARTVDGMEAQILHRLEIGRNGRSTADPVTMLEALFLCVDKVMERLGAAAADIAGVGSCTFVANITGLDRFGQPVMPLTTYADTTSWPQAERLAAELNQEATRQRVGCYFHPSYLPSRFLLWKETDMSLFRRVERWATLGEFMELVLFGKSDCSGVSYSVASWTGLLNRHSLKWDDELLEYLEIDNLTLPRLIDVSTYRAGLLSPFADRWPALREVPWFPAIGDGAAASVGSSKTDGSNTLVVTLGTTGAVRAVTRGLLPIIPEGLWCYRVDRNRLLPGGALTEGGNVHAWLCETLRMSKPASLEKALAAMRPDEHGLTILPFFAGERSLGWRGHAKATLHGMTLATTPLDVLRATMESVALRLGLIFERLRPLLYLSQDTGAKEVSVVAGGGALTASPAWTQILADVLGHSVELCGLEETSSRGVALLVLELLNASPAPVAAVVPGTLFHPDSEAHEIYLSARQRQNRLYDILRAHDEIRTP
jgi:gluconokinase